MSVSAIQGQVLGAAHLVSPELAQCWGHGRGSSRSVDLMKYADMGLASLLLQPQVLRIYHHSPFKNLLFKKDFIYLFMRDTQREREAETQAEGKAGSPRGAWCETRSQDPGITIWAKGRCSTTEPPRCPQHMYFEFIKWYCDVGLVLCLRFFSSTFVRFIHLS